MQLKSLNCKNCGNPLREENGKLHCNVCGSFFDMEENLGAQKMEHIQKSLKEAEASIETDKKALEEFMRVKEEAEIEAERKKRERMEAQMREIRKRANQKAIRQLMITLVFSAAIIILIIFLATKYKNTNKNTTAKNNPPPTYVEKNYRITPTDLKANSAFLEDLTKRTVDAVKKDHAGSVYESTTDALYIWNLNEDPYISEYYLTTREDGNYLYMLVVLPMKGDNNSPQSDDVQYKDVYVMAFVEDVYIGEDGAIHYSEDKLNFDGSSEYNFFWHADFDKDLLVREFVSAKEVDPEKPYIVHMFMV